MNHVTIGVKCPNLLTYSSSPLWTTERNTIAVWPSEFCDAVVSRRKAADLHCDYTPVSVPPPQMLFFSLFVTFTSPQHLTLNICLHPSSSGRLFFPSFFHPVLITVQPKNPKHGRPTEAADEGHAQSAQCVLHLTDSPQVFSFCWFKCTRFNLLATWMDKSVVGGTSCRIFTSFIVM